MIGKGFLPLEIIANHNWSARIRLLIKKRRLLDGGTSKAAVYFFSSKENNSGNVTSSALAIAAIFFNAGLRSPLSIPPRYVR